MTPSEKSIFKALVAIAWADGTLSEPEEGMIDSLLWAFGASERDEAELRQYAQTKRTVADVPVADLDEADRELLVAHAALLTHADGEQTKDEQQLLAALVKQLGMTVEQAKPIIGAARERAQKLASRI